MSGGFSIIFGGEEPTAEDEGSDRDAAKAALKRFRSAEDLDEALDAFEVLCRFAKADEGSDEGSDEEEDY
jgi:hypothetical protein